MQPSGMTQALLRSKSRITNRGLSIAKQELVARFTGANIAANPNKALKRWPIIESYYWTDSHVAVCWIKRPFGGWKSFFLNRIKRIKEITDEIVIKWKHVPTKIMQMLEVEVLLTGNYVQVSNIRPQLVNNVFNFFPTPRTYKDPSFINVKEIDFFYKSLISFPFFACTIYAHF